MLFILAMLVLLLGFTFIVGTHLSLGLRFLVHTTQKRQMHSDESEHTETKLTLVAALNDNREKSHEHDHVDHVDHDLQRQRWHLNTFGEPPSHVLDCIHCLGYVISIAICDVPRFLRLAL